MITSVQLHPLYIRMDDIADWQYLGMPRGCMLDGVQLEGIKALQNRMLGGDRIYRRRPYLFIVVGQEMAGAGIAHGTVVAVNTEREPERSDIVLVRIGTDLTLKTWFPPFLANERTAAVDLSLIGTRDVEVFGVVEAIHS